MKKVVEFFRSESGATAIEYGLIVGIMAVIIIGAFGIFGNTLSSVFTSITTAMTPK